MGANGAERWLANTCAAMQALGARVKLSDPVCLVLPAQHALIKFIDLPPVGPAQRAQILEFAAEQNIPYAGEFGGRAKFFSLAVTCERISLAA